jgi:hypothetical protein
MVTALQNGLGVAEERIVAITDTIKKKKDSRMFEQLIEGMPESARRPRVE